MAAPDFVPAKAVPATAKAYSSPRRRPGGWVATRPGELVGHGAQPRGSGMGYQGPDQGFALRLIRQFSADIRLAEGEHRADAEAGCVAVAMKRASLFTRAPVRDDIELALVIFGFLDDEPDRALVSWRKERFAELAHTVQHYAEARALVNAVPEATLRLSVSEAKRAYERDWHSLHQVAEQ